MQVVVRRPLHRATCGAAMYTAEANRAVYRGLQHDIHTYRPRQSAQHDVQHAASCACARRDLEYDILLNLPQSGNPHIVK